MGIKMHCQFLQQDIRNIYTGLSSMGGSHPPLWHWFPPRSKILAHFAQISFLFVSNSYFEPKCHYNDITCNDLLHMQMFKTLNKWCIYLLATILKVNVKLPVFVVNLRQSLHWTSPCGNLYGQPVTQYTFT